MRTRPDQIVNGIDSAYYLLTQPDVAAAGVDPQVHFLTSGWKEGRMPDGLFDPQYYLAQYPDVAAAGVNPLLHYLQHGAAEGRNPSATFNTSAYLAANPDVASAGVNPLLHYLQNGVFEGRSGGTNQTIGTSGNDYLIGTPGSESINAGAGNDFVITAGGNDTADGGGGVDTARFARNFLDYTITFNGNQVIVDGPEGHDVFTNFERFTFQDVAFDNRTSLVVDEFYYYALNRDVYAAGVDAATHYATHGWKEGRNPNAYFDTNYYLTQNPDVAAAGINPLQHYLDNGWREGRNPSANFDTTDYLAANPDVAAAGVNPLQHYLQYGLNEGRATTPNTAPTITSNGGADTASINVAENTSAVTTITATDAESGAALTYSKAGGADAALFNVNASTGALTFVTAPNFENPGDSDHNNTYQVIVRASDGSLADDQTITVTVTNANDAPVITSNGGGSTAAVNLAENGTTVATVAAVDDDGTTPTYAINGGADAARFSIDPSSGALTFLAAPNYESPNDADTNNTYEVVVRASDGTLTDDQTITITITDTNDIAPAFSSGATANAAENQTAAYTAVASDADGTAANNTITYSLASGGDNDLFNIASNGAVTFKVAPNFEVPGDANTDNVYNITVNASDGVHSVSRSVAITVTNVNEPPVITSDGAGTTATLSRAENTTAVTTVVVADPDVGATINYSLSGADASKFSINSSGVLTFNSAPNFEAPTDSDTNNSYVVKVTASDGTNTDEQTITVNVTDANDNAPVFSSGTTANAAENQTAAYTAVATDADGTSANNTITYSLASGGDNDLFNISAGGVVTFKVAPNHESPTDVGTDNVYNIAVHANDGLTDTTRNVAITVTDVNDNTPAISTDGAGATASKNVQENTTAVTTVQATDADSSASLTYSIVGGADQTKFTINPSSGVLTFVSAPNFENPTDADFDNVYDVTVQVSDGTNSDTQAISVTVTDVNDAPVITTGASYSVSENTAAVATVGAADEDSSIQFSLLAGGDSAKFQINPNTGELSFINAPDFETKLDANTDNVYQVTVRASDGTTNADRAIAVTVTDLNEAPTQITLTAGQIEPISGLPQVDENRPNGTVVATLSATDADAADGSPSAFTYELLDNAGGLFKIGGINGNELQVAAPIDYETIPNPGHSYDVVIRVTDSAGNQYGQTFTIKIGDADDLAAPDGYIAGATIFSDANGNLFKDANEVFTTSDQYGNFTFTPGSGNIVLSNGTDIAKGTLFNSLMVTPTGSSIISPLTTLVAAYIAVNGGTVSAANTTVLAGLGLNSGLDLPNFDPILATLSGDANGVAAIRAATMVQDTINMATAVLVGASAASPEIAGFAVAKAIASNFGSFTSDANIVTIINAAAASLTLTPDSSVVSGAADMIAGSNAFIAALSPPDNTTLLQMLTKVGKVGDDAAFALTTATSANIASLVDAYTDNTSGINPSDTDLSTKITGKTFADISGANGDNTLDGTSGPDFLNGLGGNDTLNGLAGADVLDGGDGNDFIYAGLGKDLLIGGEGTDFLDGGAWYNSFDVTGAGDVDRVSYANAISGVTVDLGGSYINAAGTIATPQFTLGAGQDTIIHVEGIIGSAFNDFLYGGGHDFQDFLETFRGGGGDDYIEGRSGNDAAEYSDATAGISVNLASGIVDGVAGGVGTDTLRSVEDIRGSAFNDTVDATGFSGISINQGSKGTYNNFRGGAGDDWLIGNGDSQLDYFDATHGVTVNLTDRSFNAITGIVHGGVGVGDDKFSGVDRVRGSLFADTLIGGQIEYSAAGKFEMFEGLAGDDFINGGSGYDWSRYIVTVGELTGIQKLNPVTGLTQTVGIYVHLAAGVVEGDGLNFGTDTLRSVEAIAGTLMDDIYDATGFGSTSVNAASPGIGLNEFDGGAGNDYIIGNGSTRISYTGATSGLTVDMSVLNNGSGTVVGDVSVGTDTFSGVNSVRGSAFADNLTGYDNATGTQVFDGRGGADIIDGRGGFDRVTYNQDNTVTHGISVTLSNVSGTLRGSVTANADEVGSDQLSNIESIVGTNFNDILTISSAPPPGSGVTILELEGAGGNDQINGLTSITGGIGVATRISYTSATAGVTVIFSGGGSGTGGNAGDIATGMDNFTGIRDVLGGLYDDIITGRYTGSTNATDSQTFQGGAGGNDILEGGSGNDTLWGGDTNNGNGTERYDGITPAGFDDVDYASYAGANGAVTVTLSTGSDGSGDGSAAGSAGGATNVGTDVLRNIEGVIGSTSGDTLNGGNNFFETFRGGAGNDAITGNGGLDNAEYTDATSAVTINLAAGTASGGSVGTDTLRSVESIWGSAHTDIYNAAGFNGASTNAGSINGGTYNVFRPGDGDDQITGNGDTVVDYSDAPTQGGTTGLTINLAAGSTVVGTGVGTDTLVSGVNQVIGSAFNDHFTGTNNANLTFEGFEGMGGDDIIDGGGGFDRAMYHLDGNISTGVTVNLAVGTVTGDPTLTGTDTLISIESITGSILADTYNATGFGPGSTNAGSFGTLNEFEGMAGNDTIIGNGNTRIAFYHASAAVTVDLNLTTGAVTGDSSVGTDNIHAVGEVNRVRGSNFNDTIMGNNFANILEGQNGNDTITGRGGNDTLVGGNGADTFFFADNDGADIVTDFAVGVDKLNLTAITGLNTYNDLEALMTEANGAVLITFSPGNSIELRAATGTLDIATLHAHQSDFLL